MEGKKEFFATCLAIGDAKHWDRALDKKTKGAGDPFSNYNPSYQIDFYLRATDIQWGILSNGRLWRLYNRETSYRYDFFYEVDLPALLERSNDLSRYYNEEFNYFFAFFRKEAFLKDVSGLSFLDKAYKESLDYAAKLGEELKENVYEALRLLAEGFLKFPANGLTENDLNAIRENIFVLIYRILFLLYAEDRRILPVDNLPPLKKGVGGFYQVYSLRNLAHEIAQKLDAGVHLSPTMVGYWSRLIDLFRIINEGDDSLDVPSYNGGLFDDAKHPFLSDYKVGDSYLAQAIDQLTRAEAAGQNPSAPFSKGGSRGFVSYRDMEIRHIGSIYEGLLEHHLRIADEDLAVVKEKFIPLASADSKKVVNLYHQGSVYLETDKGERKATGSYYTPDYIVKYIVENTVGPLLEEKKKESFERSQSAKKEIESLTKSISAYKAQLSKATTPPTKSGCSTFMQRQYQEKIDREQKRLEALRAESDPNSLLISEIQQIKVLDPAMGSGHFLVEATDFLARALVEALGASPQEVGVRGSCRVTEEDIRWARREVVERCIYGVDFNPLAVELAKLSLWLYTVSKGRPLSFLEHHLRLGNSLIGANIEDIGRLPTKAKGKRMVREETSDYGQQLTLFDENAFTQSAFKMVGGAQNIEEMPTDSVAQVKKKEEILVTLLDPIREPYRKIADFWTSAFFGNDISQPVYQQAMNLLQGKNTTLSESVLSPYIARAEELRKQKRFFHWELEFPEVFFDEHGRKKENPGFDVVVGNPPYIQLAMDNALAADLKPFLLFRYLSSMGRLNTFGFFTKLGIEHIRHHGYTSFIVPNTMLTMPYYAELRGFVLDNTVVRRLLLLDDLPFDEAIVENIVFVVQKEPVSSVRERNQVCIDRPQVVVGRCGTQEKTIRQSVFRQSEGCVFGVYVDTGLMGFQKKMQEVSDKLDMLVHINQAIALKHDRAAYLYDRPLGPEYKKLLDGRDIDRYLLDFPNVYLKYDLSAIHSCKREDIFLTQEKLLFRRVGASLVVCYDDEQHYALNTLVVINAKRKEVNLKFLLTLLNSRLLNWYFVTFLKSTKDIFSEIQARQMAQLPIRRISFNTPKEERERLVEEGKNLCAAWVATRVEEKKE